MPTITCSLSDVQTLLGRKINIDELDMNSYLFKGEVKQFNQITQEIKIELQDTNRPDLWCVEGIVRQLRFRTLENRPEYSCFNSNDRRAAGRVVVHPEMEKIRPFVGGIIVRGLNVTEDVLIACIQTQEKLAGNLGRNRKTISVGIYDLNQIKFPVHYKAIGLDEVKFVPLGFDVPMTPREILTGHPKGVEYKFTLEGFDRVPILIDDSGDVLSFPPIINSRTSGEVKPGLRDLFVEATGYDLENLILTLNIFAANLVDRGAQIEPVSVEYSFATARGNEIVMPLDFNLNAKVDLVEANKMLGQEIDIEEAVSCLERYGYSVRADQNFMEVVMPPWRRDLLHHVDIFEDIAISAGYDRFEPQMPHDYTVGRLDPVTLVSDRVREIVIGFGFEEIISNILVSADDFTARMCEPDRKMVTIKNPMTETYSRLRDRILPSLLIVEKDSSGATYPHRIFEVGESTVFDMTSNTGCKTKVTACLLISDKESEISSMQSYLDILMYNLGLEAELIPEDFPEFIPGRSGKIKVMGTIIGRIGELHPAILENFQITMPCSMFEIDLMELDKFM